MKPSKYRAKKVVAPCGMKFDSQAEYARWLHLTMLQKAGKIANLERQIVLPLVDGVKLAGAKRARPAIRLVVDFKYEYNGIVVWEDCKGMETPLSLCKRHLAKALKGIDVTTVR